MSDKKNIVIIGGGAAGAGIGTLLSTYKKADFNLTLIDPRPFQVFHVSALRTVVSKAGAYGDTFLPFDKLFSKGRGTFVHGKVASIEPNATGKGGGVVVLEDGKRVSYDALVLASGSRWAGPLAFPEARNDAEAFVDVQRQKFKDAQSYVIIGAGAVGAELAGEIRDIYPTKKITIVHGGDSPLNPVYPNKARVAIDKSLRARNIDVIYNEYIDTLPAEGETSVKTRSGKVLEADFVIPARGPRPNTEFIASLGSKVLTSQGYVNVDDTLQVKGFPSIYAAGDIIEHTEQKQWGKAQLGHNNVVVTNVLSVVAGTTPSAVYKPGVEMIFVTNGSQGGVGIILVLWNLVFGDRIVRMGKAKDLMAPGARQRLNLPA